MEDLMISADKLETIDSIMNQMLDMDQSVGCAIGILVDGQIALNKAYGNLTRQTNQQCTPETVFGIGSLTKSFTCLTLLLLQEQEKISLEDPISKHIPLNLGGKEDEIRVKHLMSHSSGIPDAYICIILESMLEERPAYRNLKISSNITSWDELYEYLDQNQDFIYATPGERFQYADIGFSLLGAVIEKVTGKKFGTVVRELVFDRLKMNSATVRSEFNKSLNQNAANGHFTDPQTKELVPTRPNYPNSVLIDAGGGIMASATDLLNYMQMIAQKGKFQETQVINSESFDEWIAPHVVRSQELEQYYAYGWMVGTSGIGKYMVHTGLTGASSSVTMLQPELEYGVVILNNTDFVPLRAAFQISQVLGIGNITSQLRPNGEQFVGAYEGLGNIERVSIITRDGDLIVEYDNVSVHGVKKLSKTLHFVKQNPAAIRYYFCTDRGDISVIFEREAEKQWLTIGSNRYLKNNLV